MSKVTYQFHLNKPLDEEAIRIFRSQVNRARRELKHPNDHGIHSARKAIKRARAFLRLVKGALSQSRFESLDCELRSIGRKLGPVRDYAVALIILDRMSGEKALEKAVSSRLWTFADASHATAIDDLRRNDQVDDLRSRLRTIRLQAGEVVGFNTLSFHDGLARTYARGRERLAQAVEQPNAETLHEWRRQVKHLGYHLRLLKPAWPLVLSPTARAFDKLSEVLGDDHDLAELVRLAKLANLGKSATRAVQRMARKHRKVLQATAWPLGARLYAEEASPFASRLTVYLAAALAEEHDAPVYPLGGMALPAPPNRPPMRMVKLS